MDLDNNVIPSKDLHPPMVLSIWHGLDGAVAVDGGAEAHGPAGDRNHQLGNS